MPTIAIVGSGSSSLGYIDGLIAKLALLPKDQQRQFRLEIFEKSPIAGSGLPYDKTIASLEHLINIHTVSTSMPAIAFSEDEQEKDDAIKRKAFFKWINNQENKDYIEKEFQKVFFDRFKKAYKRKYGDFSEDLFEGKMIFDEGFEQSEFYKINHDEEGFLEMLDYHRKKFATYKSKVEASYKEEKGFLPRIVYGFYAKALFDYKVAMLAKIIGPENIRIRTSTEVNGIEGVKTPKLRLKYGQESSEFDNVFIATGLWQEEPQAQEDDKYVSNIWPISNVENALEKAIDSAKKQGKKEARIAIKGTALSAIDVVRTIFKDGKEVDGVKLKVDMISRNGRLQKVKGNFTWLIQEWTKYFPQALESVFKEYGLEGQFDFNYRDEKVTHDQLNAGTHMAKLSQQIAKITQKIVADNKEKLIKEGKEPKDVFYMWQAVKLFFQIAQKAYENAAQSEEGERKAGLVEKAKYSRFMADFVEKNQNNYKLILDELFRFQDSNPFVQLEKDLAASQIGDTKDGDYIFENIYGLFMENIAFAKYLPKDELIFRKFYSRSFLGPLGAAMPPESAQHFLDLHKENVLDAKSVGYNQDSLRDMGYDLIIDTARNDTHKTTQSELLRSLIEAKVLDSSPITLSKEELSQFDPEYIRGKYGDEAARNMLKIAKETGENLTFDSNIIDKANFSAANSPNLTINLGAWGISAAIRSAKMSSEKLVSEFVAAQPLSVSPSKPLASAMAAQSSLQPTA